MTSTYWSCEWNKAALDPCTDASHKNQQELSKAVASIDLTIHRPSSRLRARPSAPPSAETLLLVQASCQNLCPFGREQQRSSCTLVLCLCPLSLQLKPLSNSSTQAGPQQLRDKVRCRTCLLPHANQAALQRMTPCLGPTSSLQRSSWQHCLKTLMHLPQHFSVLADPRCRSVTACSHCSTAQQQFKAGAAHQGTPPGRQPARHSNLQPKLLSAAQLL